MPPTPPESGKKEDVARLRAEILELVGRYWKIAHRRNAFEPGKTRIQYSGRVYDQEEMVNLAASCLDFWLTLGPYGDRFESRMRDFFSSEDFVLVNSGSAANLLMIAAVCAEELDRILKPSDRSRLYPGDEIITPAVTFPTTLAPIVQNRLVPVFVDCEVGTYNINPTLVDKAVGPMTRAVFVPHTLGLPCDMDAILDVAKRHNLWVLEDSCDALGATFNGKLVGTFGDLASLSFYPAHHITMGEGGGVVVNRTDLMKTVRSLRDWGRDCWCGPGKSNTCGRRFDWKLGDLPVGYDHKYIYSNIGFNLKPTDLQAAIGLAQLDKAPEFISRRRHNFKRLYEALQPLHKFLVLPRVHPRGNPSPFGFPITLSDGIDRTRIIQHLENANIETRLVFGGNILRQPGYRNIERRIYGSLEQSDKIMRNTFFVGVYPGLDDRMMDYIAESIIGYFSKTGL